MTNNTRKSSTGTSCDMLLETPGVLQKQHEISMNPEDTLNRFVQAYEDSESDNSQKEVQEDSTRLNSFSWPPGFIVFFFTFVNFLIYSDGGAFAAGLKQIIETFDINQTLGGVLGAAGIIGYCITSPFFAYAANFAPPLKILTWGMLVWVVAVQLGGLSKSYEVLLICRGVAGVGESSFLTVAPTIIDAIAPPAKRSLWLALFFSALPVGYAMGEATGGIIVDSKWWIFRIDESWRMLFVVEPILVLIMVLILCSIKGPKNILHLDGENAVKDTDTMCLKLKILANNPTYVFSVLAYSAQTFTVTGASYYMIEYFQDIFGLSTAKSGMIFGGVTLCFGFLGTSLGGMVLDRVKLKKDCEDNDLMPMSLIAINISILFMALAIGPALLFPFVSELTLVVILVSWSLLFVFMSSGPTNNAILWSVDLKDRTFAMALSVFCNRTLGGAAAQVIFGVLIDAVGWSWALFIGMCPWALCAVLFVLASIFARRAINVSKKENIVPLLQEN